MKIYLKFNYQNNLKFQTQTFNNLINKAMKKLSVLPFLLLFVLASCSSVRVNSDYDKQVDFTAYKTYAFHKTGIDKAEISDLDKKRILRSIDETMTAKGFAKSETPDLLIAFFTKEREIFCTSYPSGF